jgi:hypothetical protein
MFGGLACDALGVQPVGRPWRRWRACWAVRVGQTSRTSWFCRLRKIAVWRPHPLAPSMPQRAIGPNALAQSSSSRWPTPETLTCAWARTCCARRGSWLTGCACADRCQRRFRWAILAPWSSADPFIPCMGKDRPTHPGRVFDAPIKSGRSRGLGQVDTSNARQPAGVEIFFESDLARPSTSGEPSPSAGDQ